VVSLIIKGVSHSYGRNEVLRNVDLSIGGECLIGILGPNGAGKTTLMKIIAGLLKPTRGDVLIDGSSINELSPSERAKLVTYVSPFINLSMNITVIDYLTMSRYPWIKLSLSKEDYEVLEYVINSFNLHEFLHRYLSELSSGELSRVIVARAISQGTKVVLLDELISFLDLGHQIRTLKKLKELAKGRVIMVSTHVLIPTLNYVDKVVLLKGGNLVKFGDPHKDINDSDLSSLYGVKLKVLREGGNILLDIVE